MNRPVTESTQAPPLREEYAQQGGRWVAIWICLFWLALPWFGLLGPHSLDDTVFVSPAIDFAQGRPMSSHIILLPEIAGGTAQHSERWLSHPPLYQQILGSWLRATGVSSASMLGFQAAANLAIYAGLLLLLRRFRIHWGWSIPPASLLFVAGFRTWGMRPELTGMALLLFGVLALLRRDTAGSFLAGLCLTASGIVLQQAGIYAALFGAVWLADIAISRPATVTRPRLIYAMIAGAFIPVALFLVGIGWDVSGFIHSYRATLVSAAGMSKSRTNTVCEYWIYATYGWEWINLAAMIPLFVVVGWGAFRAQDRLVRGLLFALLAGLLINTLAVQAHWYRLSFMYVLVAFAAFTLLGACGGRALWLRLISGVTLTAAMALLALPELCARYVRVPDNAEAVRTAVARCPDALAIYLDDYATWYVFNWQLPERARSLQNCRRYSPLPASKGEIFIMPESDYRKMPLRLFGRVFRSINLNSHRWEVVDFHGDSLLTGEHLGLDLQIH